MRFEQNRLVDGEMFDMPCFAHIVNIIGETLVLPNASRLLRLITSLFSFSHGARAEWRELAGSYFPSHSETRWYSLFKVGAYVARNFPTIEIFLRQCPYGMHKCKVVDTSIICACINMAYHVVTIMCCTIYRREDCEEGIGRAY
jgi:hypothetical protein